MQSRGIRWVVAAYGLAGAAALATGWWALPQGALLAAWWADLAGTAVVFLFSLGGNNSSVYDPYWSVAPVPLAAFWAWQAGTQGEPRTWIVLAIVTLWSVRLTANWVRRWRGLDDEDWRYEDIRRSTGRWYWPASFLGIHLLPTALVFAGSAPLFLAVSSGGARPVLFGAGCALAIGGIALEAAADAQLREFLRRRGPEGGFLASGLWGRMRHPNYTGEILFWWGLALAGLGAAPGAWWAPAGATAISLLFVGVSVPLMDRRMTARHPGYRSFREEVPALLPRPRGSGPRGGVERRG